jgi:hypothetical protein
MMVGWGDWELGSLMNPPVHEKGPSAVKDA